MTWSGAAAAIVRWARVKWERVKWARVRFARAKWVWAMGATVPILAGCERAAVMELPATGVDRVELTPAAVAVAPTGDADFVAAALTASGDTADVAVTWQATGGSITDGGTNRGRHLGHYKAGGFCGDYTVVATAHPGNKSDTASITVTCPVPVATVEVTPAAATIMVGATVQLSATLRDSTGAVLTGRVVTWSSGAGGVAAVSADGLVSGLAAGSATITATREGVSGTASVTVTAPPAGASVVFVGAGDIADCGSSGDEATAVLLDGIAGTVFTTGDNVYNDGSATQFAECYEPTWGRHKARTRPSPGNHDYRTSGASGYYVYFGANAGEAGNGYYSFDLGEWHIISLNSNVSMSAGSAQEQWLRADLAATIRSCVLAYWHHPRFSSGDHGSSTGPQPLWQALYDHDADVVLAGHDHNYERFAPQTPDGVRDDARGIREFVVGTGGTGFRSVSSAIANSETTNDDTFGVLKLTLSAGGYAWEFVPVAGGTYRDSGTAACH
jgi:hypothetical protein